MRTKKLNSANIGNGWITSDNEEIERRRLRAHEEALRVSRAEGSQQDIYSDYHVHSKSCDYYVEYRHPQKFINSCNCPDFQVNGLGTCKHIERVAQFLKRKKIPPFRSQSEVFLNTTVDGGRVEIMWADRVQKRSKAYQHLAPYFSKDRTLKTHRINSFTTVIESILQGKIKLQNIRISQLILPWLEKQRSAVLAEKERLDYLRVSKKDKHSKKIVKLPLYAYQKEGMLHLAFKRRAILADEMGLGKTVQAIAACELLRQKKGVSRVLVISPVSLKTEWEEQISKFTDLSSRIVQGNKERRLGCYRSDDFFCLANYEQILYDFRDIQNLVAPDIIILDEAQRVKNWQTKTAQMVKKLSSPYIFVLTGTPLENRIDEIYSIAQLVNPETFGPLFRFNRQFYQLDEQGRPIGYKNLDQLHNKLSPILLRRRKADVENELPSRVTNNYFVGMHSEQVNRYDEYKAVVAKLMNKARRMPLTPQDHKRLQMSLACMRMLCDSPYILDQNCRVSPKLDELKKILDEQLSSSGIKIIIFSEWVKMLELVQEHLDKQGIDYALHTGKVNQKKRRLEINRFKKDADCRIFLSSDSGASGLNLQAASVVINLDLPWNPAKLEQRIARAWRKHQDKQVNVINLVCENSIEHRMLDLLKQKSRLAEGVLDGNGDASMALPSGRKAMLERLEQVMAASEQEKWQPKEPLPEKVNQNENTWQHFTEEVKRQAPKLLRSSSIHVNDQGKKTLFAVVKGNGKKPINQINSIAADYAEENNTQLSIEAIDSNTMLALRRLLNAGIITLNPEHASLLGEKNNKISQALKNQWLKEAWSCFYAAEKKFKMANLLFHGGFEEESIPSLKQALEQGFDSLNIVETGKPTPQLSTIKNKPFLQRWSIPAKPDQLERVLFGKQYTLKEGDLSCCEAVLGRIKKILSNNNAE